MNANRTMKRRYVAGGAAAVLAAAIAAPTVAAFADDQAESPQQPEAEYELSELPKSEVHPNNRVEAIDPAGEYIVGYAYGDEASSPLLWHDGEVEEVEVPDTSYARFLAVNSAGTAVGTSYFGAADVLFLYQDGELTMVEGSEDFEVSDISEAGDLVGSYTDENDIRHAAVWRDGAEEPDFLDVPDQTTSAAIVGVNEDGEFGGYYSGGGHGQTFQAKWDADGNVSELDYPDDVSDEAILRMDAMAGEWLIAHIAETQGEFGTVRWNLTDGTGEKLTEDSVFEDVNAEGWTSGRGGEDSQPALFADGELILLPVLDDVDSLQNNAVAISDGGQLLAGNVQDADDTTVAVTWTAAE